MFSPLHYYYFFCLLLLYLSLSLAFQGVQQWEQEHSGMLWTLFSCSHSFGEQRHGLPLASTAPRPWGWVFLPTLTPPAAAHLQSQLAASKISKK